LGARLPLVEFDSLTLPQIAVALGLDEEVASDAKTITQKMAVRSKRRPSPDRRNK
jgi:transcription initiation factor TFIIIB Brf1 subunit/transcription initiation factor TFIIB